MALLLTAPDDDPYDGAGSSFLPEGELVTVWNIVSSPEDFTDYLLSRGWCWMP